MRPAAPTEQCTCLRGTAGAHIVSTGDSRTSTIDDAAEITKRRVTITNRRGSATMPSVSQWHCRADPADAGMLLRGYDARAFAAALDVYALAGLQIRVDRLRDRDEHAAPEANDDLLAGCRLIVLLLHLVPCQRAAQRSDGHGDVTSGTAADQ